LIETSAAQLRTSRLDRLDDAEKVEYAAAIAALADPTAPDSDHWLERLGRLGGKADAYAPVDRTDAPGDIRVSARIYRAVWKEASEMRRSGELLRRVQMVRCLVVAIHGDADSSPAAGVAGPLSDAIEQFRFTVLGRCGHTPWLERYATDSFYSTLLAEIG
jgi:hypothetical protein